MDHSVDDYVDPTRHRFQPNRIDLEKSTYFEEYKRRWNELLDLSELFHEHTKLREKTSQRMGRSISLFETPPLQYFQSASSPEYPGSELIELPTDVDLTADIATVLNTRRSVREYADHGLGLEELSRILLYSCGRTHERSVESLGITTTQHFRTYPSAGALYPVEIYLLVFHSDDLDTGVYYYSVGTHGLRKLSVRDDVSDLAGIFLDPVSDWNTSVAVLLTGAFWRAKMKYGPRGYRYTLQESGHIAQNIQLVSHATNVGSVPLASFYDDGVNELLDIDGVNEAVVYAIALGNLEPNP